MYIYIVILGMDIENKEPVVGFRVGAYNQGKTSVAPIDNISNVPQRMKDVVKVSFYLEINSIFMLAGKNLSHFYF